MTDSQCGWVEVTDRCDISCPGCYRNTLEGPRPLDEIERDIVACQEQTRCDSLSIAGGEPLTYPRLLEVVRFIAGRGMKPVILTNGVKLDARFARELKRAGLAKIHFHVDSMQRRPGWTGRSEAELNALREHFAELLFELGGVQCGFHVTVYRATLAQIPDVVRWCWANIRKVQHLSLIAFRAFPRGTELRYLARGRVVPDERLPSDAAGADDISVTTDEMFAVLEAQLPWMRPCAFLCGTASPRLNKHLVIVTVGTRHEVLGTLGARTVELVQSAYHLARGRYCSFLRKPRAGKKLFLLAPLDAQVAKALLRFAASCLRHPARLLDGIYTQSLNLQQPIEIHEGRTNLCDPCINPMVHAGRIIPPCQLDDYRLFGAALTPVRVDGIASRRPLDRGAA